MMKFSYPILEELLRVLMIGVIGMDYPGPGVRPIPFSTEHPPCWHFLVSLFTKLSSQAMMLELHCW